MTATANAAAIAFCINLPLALIAFAGSIGTDRPGSTGLSNGNKSAVHPLLSKKFFKISVLAFEVTLFLRIKVVVTEFMAHDFAKDFQTLVHYKPWD